MEVREPAEMPVFLTVGEAAAVLRLKRSTAYEPVRRGETPHFRLGHFIGVPQDALLRMADGAQGK